MGLELGRHGRRVDDVFDLPCAKRARPVQNVFEHTRAHVPGVVFPGYVEQDEGKRLLHARQSPEGDPPEWAIVLVQGDEAPFAAHRTCGEHVLEVLLDFVMGVGGAGGFDEEVELVDF
jgi:hypothetical protein